MSKVSVQQVLPIAFDLEGNPIILLDENKTVYIVEEMRNLFENTKFKYLDNREDINISDWKAKKKGKYQSIVIYRVV